MKFRKRSQKKTYILPTIFSIMVMLMVLASCSVEGSVYRIQYPKFSFQPYSFPLGDESAYAEVTFLTSYDTDFPKVVEINGNIYYVAVFNGYKENVDLSQITTINVDDCIQAINSHAYEHASSVTTLSIPNVLSLGEASLPENLTTLTVNAEAIDTVGTRPLYISLPNPDKLESLTITGKTRYSIDLSCIGGETSSLPVDGLVINVALTGRVEKGCAVLRSGGKPGDALFVSGRLGGSFPSQRHLSFEPRVALARALLAAGLRPRAMMDLSDGLATDLPRLAGASGCGYELFPERLPLHPGCSVQQALGDGEDYELLFALSPEQALRAEREFESPVVLTRIGRLTAESCSTLGGGWQHFRNR